MKKKILIIIVCAVLLGGLTEYFGPTLSLPAGDFIKDKGAEEASVETLAPIISAEGAILMNAETGEVIYEKDADKRLYPASTTKIMTTLVALEIMDEINADLDSEVKVDENVVGIEGSSIYLKKGEMLSVEELLYGTMHQSGNDAATCLALSASGDLERFVLAMNERAQKIGCKNTHFMNPSGLTHENHYTSARDLALISREALKNQKFRKIASSKGWPNDDSVVESPKSGRSFRNKNKTINQYDGATGVKIGYTKASGRTLVASAKRNGKELIAVVLNDSNWFNDAYALMDYGFRRIEDDASLYR